MVAAPTVATGDEACARPCKAYTCGDLQHGFACSYTNRLGCDCTGCCAAATASTPALPKVALGFSSRVQAMPRRCSHESRLGRQPTTTCAVPSHLSAAITLPLPQVCGNGLEWNWDSKQCELICAA